MVITNGDAIDLQIEQIKEYQVFKDHGKAVYEKNKVIHAPKEYQKIRVHFVFDAKHGGKFKARLVADGHLTKEPNETVYTGVVSLKNLDCQCSFQTKWSTAVGSRCWECILSSTHK